MEKVRGFLEARKAIRQTEGELGLQSGVAEKKDARAVPPELFKYFFDLQGKIEKTGAMDYLKYGKQAWQELVGPSADEEGEQLFTRKMVEGLHAIDMRGMVYPHIRENLVELIERYGDRVNDIVLWSTGDVSATAYQLAKVDQSEIVEDFYESLEATAKEISASAVVPARRRAKQFLKEKTGYIVDDNKFPRLEEYLRQLLDSQPADEPVKLVVIEDSVSNLDRVAGLATSLKDSAGTMNRIDVVPIWATYSREGQKAKATAEKKGAPGEYEEQRRRLHGIDSFADLLDEQRFGPAFADSHVLVDFDGVIADNVEMRNRQAVAIYEALLEGVSADRGLDPEAAAELIQQHLGEFKS